MLIISARGLHNTPQYSGQSMFKNYKSDNIFTENQQQNSRPRAKSDTMDRPPYLHSLHYLEPNPIQPPSYKSANPNPTIRYPVYEIERNALVEDKLPEYSPAVNSIVLIMRKVELLSPYEMSAIRNWRNLVMEINSTQVNFYTIDGLPFLDRVLNKKKGVYDFTEFEQHLILEAINHKKDLYLTPKRLVRSYTLQMAKFGLPVDYNKKNYCLRIRLETEQMLLKFVSLNDLLTTSNNLSIGINVSLDLSQRELPKDKTVPRRRRRNRRRRSRRERANSDTDILAPVTTADVNGDGSMVQATRRSSVAGTTTLTIRSEMNNKNIKSNFFGKLFKSKSSNSSSDSNSLQTTAVASTPHHDEPMDIDKMTRSLVDSNLKSFELSQRNNAVIYEEDDDDGEDEEEEQDEGLDVVNSYGTLLTSRTREERQRRGSSSSNEFDSDVESLSLDLSNSSNYDLKTWKPSYKILTQKKIYKDALRCLNLMTHNDNWIGKTVIRFDKGLYCNVDTRALKDKTLREFIVGPRGFIPVV